MTVHATSIRPTFAAYADYLGDRNERKIAHNTYVEWFGRDCIAIRFHATRIISFTADGRILLTSGGYRTVTTKDRLNQFGPAEVRIHQANYAWYVTTPTGEYPFVDGIEVTSLFA